MFYKRRLVCFVNGEGHASCTNLQDVLYEWQLVSCFSLFVLQGRLKNIVFPRTRQCTGTHTYTTTITLNVDNIEHIFIVWYVFPPKSMIKYLKTCHTRYRQISSCPPDNCPASPYVKTALVLSTFPMSKLSVLMIYVIYGVLFVNLFSY